MQQVLLKSTLKAGKREAFSEYLAEFAKRRDECNVSLQGEGAVLESFFIDGDNVYIFKRLADYAASKDFQKKSDMPIYDLVRKMIAECLEGETAVLYSVLDIDLL